MRLKLAFPRLLLILFLAACTPPTQTPSLPTPTQAVTITATPRPSPTVVPPTPTASATPTPTATPTLALPVGLQTALPSPAEVISAGNVAQLHQFAYAGAPVIWDFVLTSDGQRGFLLTSAGVVVYELDSGQVIGQFPAYCPSSDNRCYENAVSISRDGSRFAVIGEESVQVWSLNDGLLFEIPLNNPERSFNTASLSADGSRLAISDTEAENEDYWAPQIKVYAVPSGDSVDTPNFYGTEMFFSPGGRWAVERFDRQATIWEVDGWRKHRDILVSTEYREGILAWSPDDRLVALQQQGTVLIYEVEGWRLVRQITLPVLAGRTLTRVVTFAADYPYLAIDQFAEDKLQISLYDLQSGERLESLDRDYGFEVTTFTPDGQLASALIPGEVCLALGYPSPEDCKSWPWFVGQVRMAARADGSFAIWQESPLLTVRSEICLIQPGTASTCRRLDWPTFIDQAGQAFSIRPVDGQAGYEVLEGLTEDASVIGQFPSPRADFQPWWMSPDRRLLAALSSEGGSYNFELWDIQAGQRLQSWYGYPEVTTFRPDGKQAALAIGGRLLLYSAEENKARTVLTYDGYNYSRYPRLAAGVVPVFRQGGSLVYALANGRLGENENEFGCVLEFVQLDLETFAAEPLLQLEVDQRCYATIATAVSGDDSLLALGLEDGTIRIFDMSSSVELHAWRAHRGNISQLAFTPDGQYLVSLAMGLANNGDGYLRVWGIGP